MRIFRDFLSQAQKKKRDAELAARPRPRSLRKMEEFSATELAVLHAKLVGWCQRAPESLEVFELLNAETGDPWQN